MPIPFNRDINLNGNEIQNGVLQNLAAAPASPKTGQFYFNTTDNTLYVYNGTAWVDALKQGIIYSAGTGIDITGSTISLDSNVKYAVNTSFTVDTSTYVLTLQLKDQNGNNLGTAQTVDLPLESVVVSGSYDDTNQKIVLTLENGSTIDIPVADLVAGLQSEITSTNKLDADLVDDSTSVNKFVTAAQRTQIGTNASDISTINSTLSGYGNIVTHNTSEFATAAQGALADTALQNSSDIVTALGFTPIQKITVSNPALTVSGGQVTWTIANTIASADVTVCVYDTSANTMVFTEITVSASNVVIKMNASANISAGAYKAVITG